VGTSASAREARRRRMAAKCEGCMRRGFFRMAHGCARGVLGFGNRVSRAFVHGRRDSYIYEGGLRGNRSHRRERAISIVANETP
jgi:hypothetical protein